MRTHWDKPTALLTLAMIGGQLLTLLFWKYLPLPGLIGFVLGCIWMNFSFTTWHECAHGNFSSKRWLNDTWGILSSFFSLGPGYFSRRREHLAHHRWEGNAELDPVYPRVQCSVWWFPFHLLLLRFRSPQKGCIPKDFLPLTPGQVLSDRLLRIAIMSVSFALILAGYFKAWLCVLALPRIAIFFLHAIYICHLPHAVEGGGFEVFRNRRGGRFWTLGQNLHGVHHKNPHIPWHRYAQKSQ